MSKEYELTENEKGNKALVALWRQLIADSTLSWVVFKNGTVVIPLTSGEGLVQQALSIIITWGRASSDTLSADFTVIDLGDIPGWVVTSHFLTSFDMLTYVGPEELDNDSPPADLIGRLGCEKRERDATECVIIHIEDRRDTKRGEIA